MARDIAGAFSEMSGASGLLNAFRAAFHGNTRAMAQALGVTPRAVQRYYTTGAQSRKPGPATRLKMAAHVPMQAHVQGEFYFDTPGFRSSPDTRQRNITFSMSAAEMSRINDALASGNDAQAHELFFEAYGMAAPDEVLDADYSFSL